MGVTKSFAGLVVCRFFLGLCEAGFFPGKMGYSCNLRWLLILSRLRILDLNVLS